MSVLLLDSQLRPARVSRHATASRRLRLEIPGLLGDRHLARRVEGAARALPGVLSATADLRSGRMLLRYAPGAPLLSRLREEPAARPGRWDAPARRPWVSRRAAQALPILGDGAAPPWHHLEVAEVLSRLGTSEAGLDPLEIDARLQRYGSNSVDQADERSRLAILSDQVANLPMGLLLGSAGFSALMGEAVEASAILLVVGANAAIGYHIERKNQAILSSWRRLEAGIVQVIRGGVLHVVSAAELVPGDVLICVAGDVLPADARVIDSRRLACDEAALTGESEAQRKGVAPAPRGAPLAERHSMLYAGTMVATGRGRAVVVATGGDTELAKVRRLVETAQAPAAPLTRRLESLGDGLAALSLGAAGIAAAAGLARGRSLSRVARGAVALGVAAVPEGLPVVATAALVRSMQRLHRHGIVVRRLAAAEALGTVTVICTDKTGTLTRNEMHLDRIDLGDGAIDPGTIQAAPDRLLEDPASLLLAAAILNSDVHVQERGGAERPHLVGSATERALVDAAHAAGLDGAQLHRDYPRRELRERREDIRYVLSVHDTVAGPIAFVKGAPAQVIELCDADWRGPLRPEDRERLLRRNDELASAGLRVLALAWKRIDRPDAEDHASGFTFLGLAGLRDPLREGAKEAIRRARSAGIRTLILTGDQPRTAEAIARELGLGGGSLLAGELAALGDAELADRLAKAAVLARVTPEEKVEVVRLLQRRGQIVAMAGDGINDAPALKVADVGISVGAQASDLARQVADLVMAGDDLRSVLVAVGEGRIVQDNLRRSLRFLCATNLSEIAMVLGAGLVGAREPLGPLQLLWINLLTDTFPALALALEPGDPEVLDRPPMRPGEAVLGKGEVARLLRDGMLLTAIGAGAMWIGGPGLVFASLPAAQLAYAVACRAPSRTMGGRVAADRRFAAMVGGAAALQLVGVATPGLRGILGATSSRPASLAAFGAGLLLPLIAHGIPAFEGERRSLRIVRHGRSIESSSEGARP